MNIMQDFKSHYQESLEDPEHFWMEQAKAIDWFVPPKQGITKDEKGFVRWFKGGKLNTSYLALDYHVKNGRADQTALIYESPVSYDSKSYTYQELLSETEYWQGF